MSKKFINFVIVLLLFAGAVVFTSLNGKPHAYHLLALICAITCGWYAGKTKFGQL